MDRHSPPLADRRVLADAADVARMVRRQSTSLRRGRRLRTERGWTLKDLSEASGVSVSQLSSIERGAHLPSLESMLAVARAMDLAPSDWLRSAGF